MMSCAERIETRNEDDPTCIIDPKNRDKKVPSSDEYSPDLHEPHDGDGEVPVNYCPIKPMSDVCVQSLNAAKSALQKKVLVGNILPKLHKSAGGFLDDVERDKVENGGSNRTKMHILIEILKTKDEAALTTFYKVLEALKYVEAAEKLKKEFASRGYLLTSSLGDRPSEIELNNVSKIVGGQWENVLVHVGVPAAKIEALFLDFPGRTQSAFFQGLIFWRKGNEPCRPATWSVLLEALEKGAGLKEYADRRRSELLSLETACQKESLEKTHKVLREKNVALSLSNLVATVRKLHPTLAKVLTEFRRHVSQCLSQSMYDEVRSICQTTIASRAGVSSFDTFDIPLGVSEFAEYIIKKHTTTFDIELIHEVANLLQQPTLTDAVEEYETVLKPLVTTSIAELTDRCEEIPINQDSPEGTYRLVLKFPDDANVKNLYKAKDYLEKVLHIPDANLMSLDFGCILAYFEITCTPDTLKDLPKRFTKHSDELKAMGISGAFLIDHWAWGADSDDVWYTNDESDDMEVNDQQGFLGNRKRSHLESVSGGCAEMVPSKKASHLKENCPTEKESGDRQGTAEEDCCSQPPHSPLPWTEERKWREQEELRAQDYGRTVLQPIQYNQPPFHPSQPRTGLPSSWGNPVHTPPPPQGPLPTEDLPGPSSLSYPPQYCEPHPPFPSTHYSHPPTLSAPSEVHVAFNPKGVSYSHVTAKDVIKSLNWSKLRKDIEDMLTKPRVDTLERHYKLIDSTCNAKIEAQLHHGHPADAASELLKYFEKNHNGDGMLRFCKFLRNEAKKAGESAALEDLADRIERTVKDQGSL